MLALWVVIPCIAIWMAEEALLVAHVEHLHGSPVHHQVSIVLLLLLVLWVSWLLFPMGASMLAIIVVLMVRAVKPSGQWPCRGCGCPISGSEQTPTGKPRTYCEACHRQWQANN